MKSFSIYVPAKAMLFGEYGALYGYPTAALTFFKYHFHLKIKLSPKSGQISTHIIKSAWFGNGGEDRISLNIEDDYPQDSHLHFFKNILAPYAEHLKHFDSEIVVEKSFSPSLGFGSSSALISGTHRVLFEAFYGSDVTSSSIFWKHLFDSLYRIQNKGSGYDICLQALNSTFLLEKAAFSKFYQYKKVPSSIPFWEEFTPAQKNHLGIFLATGVYASTKTALEADALENFALKHGELACEFLANMELENIKKLMKKSIAISEKQRIIPLPGENSSFSQICDRLRELDIPFKTMGSGYGDCLWALCTPAHLPDANHPVLNIPWKEAVMFDFGKDI